MAKSQHRVRQICLPSTISNVTTSSETQWQSVGSGEKAGRKFSSKGGRAPGYRLSPDHFQKFKRMPAPDWEQKMFCIILSSFRVFVHDGRCLDHGLSVGKLSV